MNKLPFFRLSASLNVYSPKTKQIFLSNAFMNNLPSFLPLEHARHVMSCSGLIRPRKILSVLIIKCENNDYQMVILFIWLSKSGVNRRRNRGWNNYDGVFAKFMSSVPFPLKDVNTVTYYPSDTDYLFLYNQMLTSEIREYKCILLALFPSSNKFPSHSYVIKKFKSLPSTWLRPSFNTKKKENS